MVVLFHFIFKNYSELSSICQSTSIIANIMPKGKKKLEVAPCSTSASTCCNYRNTSSKKNRKEISAVGNLNNSGVDDTETIILEYGGGRRAVLNVQSRLVLLNRATIYGTKGHITLEDPFHFPDKVTAIDGTLKTFPLHTSNLPFVYGNSAGLAYQDVEATRCIRAGLIESPRMSHKEGLVLSKLMDTVRSQLGVHYDADDQEFP